MRASYLTSLSLLEWCEWIGIHPWYFSQITIEADNSPFPARSGADCDNPVFQYAWQFADMISREDVARAIQDAEILFNNICNYWPAPRYTVGETHPYPQNARMDTYPYWGDQRGQYRTIQTNNYYIQAVGIEDLDDVDLAVDISSAYDDLDNDTVDETVEFTVTVAAGTLASEIAVFFHADDRLGKPLSEMEIKPLRISVSGTTATIIGYAYQFVLPIHQVVVDPEPLAHDTAANFADTVAVYRRTTDAGSSGTIYWEAPNESCTPLVLASTSAGYGNRDSVHGYVTPQPAEYSAGSYTSVDPAVSWRAPDRCTINYLSGFPRRSDLRMDDLHRDIICNIATAKLPRRICACRSAQQRVLDLQSVPSSAERAFTLSQVHFNASPLMGTRGELEAALLINRLPLMAGGSVH